MKPLIKLLMVMAPMTAIAQSGDKVPLVMNAENTFAKYAKPALPAVEKLPVIKELPNPLQGVKKYKDWESFVGNVNDDKNLRSIIVAADWEYKGILEAFAILIPEAFTEPDKVCANSTAYWPPAGMLLGVEIL